jgi:predicted nucleotide-binding protein
VLQKRKYYAAVKFQPSTLRLLEEYLWNLERPRLLQGFPGSEISETPTFLFTGHVSTGDEEWTFDSIAEWKSAYRQNSATSASYSLRPTYEADVRFEFYGTGTAVTVSGASREQVQAVFEFFEDGVQAGTMPSSEVSERLPATVRIFIGHGRSPLWRDLKDHLQDKHGFSVEAYEVGARAGLSIQEVLTEMVDEASFALLVHTAEDTFEGTDEARARQNVVHETGLFQGRLGFRRAIILREAGCEGFSNVVGTNELRFEKGRIAEVFGDVLATIHREFGGRA